MDGNRLNITGKSGKLKNAGKARFIGVQKGIDDIPDTPLFNIEFEGHPINRSTISLEKVTELGLTPIFHPLPNIPTPFERMHHLFHKK